jgi:23S rRNA pseudouridine955/2504/2580 synthase
MGAQFDIEAANAGRRLEAVVFDLLADVPRSRLMKWLRTGKIRLNGARTRPHARLCAGDTVALPFDPGTSEYRPQQAPPAPGGKSLPAPDVLFEDEVLLVVNKPAHLAAHPGMQHHHDSLIARILGYLDAHTAPVGRRPGLSQRLDAGVSGIVPCGKNAAVLRVLSGPPHGPPLRKTYTALVAGGVAGDGGTITAPLRVTDAPMGNVPKVVVDADAGLPAHTDYRVIQRFTDATLLEVTLRTGRTHQIRAHLRHIGHSLLGDPRYGDAARNSYLAQSFGVHRPLLHAGRLQMQHPVSGAPLDISAPLPHDMQRLLKAFGRR